MAIVSLDQLLAASNQLKSFGKVSMTAKAAGTFQSLWTAAGLPAAGANQQSLPCSEQRENQSPRCSPTDANHL